jgi:hypothetical protein
VVLLRTSAFRLKGEVSTRRVVSKFEIGSERGVCI